MFSCFTIGWGSGLWCSHSAIALRRLYKSPLLSAACSFQFKATLDVCSLFIVWSSFYTAKRKIQDFCHVSSVTVIFMQAILASLINWHGYLYVWGGGSVLSHEELLVRYIFKLLNFNEFSSILIGRNGYTWPQNIHTFYRKWYILTITFPYYYGPQKL